MTDEICIENPDSREPQSPAPRGRHSAGAAGHASASSESKVRNGKAAHAASKPGRAAARKAAHGKGKPPKRRKKARRGHALGRLAQHALLVAADGIADVQQSGDLVKRFGPD